MSFRGSNATACAESLVLERNGLILVSRSPATTCAAVTTFPGAATQPEPSTPRPHAVPSTRTTLGAASRTPGRRSTPGSGGGTWASGPPRAGKGSSLASACRTVDGGKRLFSLRRTSERCTSRRQCGCPGSWSATTPAAQASSSPDAAPRRKPPVVSSERSGGILSSSVLSESPIRRPSDWKRTTSRSPPPNAITGA